MSNARAGAQQHEIAAEERGMAAWRALVVSTGRGVRRSLLLCLGVVAAWLVYSSLNARLWGQYRRMVDVCWNGTRDLRDLDRIIQDRAYYWDNDGLFEYYYDADVDATLIHYPLGITGTTEMVDGWIGLVTAAVLLFLGCHAVTSLILWRCVRRRLAGLDGAFFRLPGVRRARRRIVERAFVVAACVLPAAAALSWYVFYDRIQSSFDRPDGSVRWARYLYQSFSPRGEDWALIAACVLGAVSWYAWVAARRFVRGLDPGAVEPYHRMCSACGYSIEGLAGPCPECGLASGEPARVQGWLTPRRAAVGVVLLGLCAATAGVLMFRGRYEGYVYEPQWLTMRGHVRKSYPDLYLFPNRPVMLRWNGVDVWIVVWYREPFSELPSQPGIFHANEMPTVIYRVGDGEVTVMDAPAPRHGASERLMVKGQEVLIWAWVGKGPMVTYWPNVTGFPVIAEPEAVRGFPPGEALSPEAKRFLAECKDAVARWPREPADVTP